MFHYKIIRITLIGLSALVYVILVTFSGCAPVPYANVGQNVPMFKNKGEVNLNGGLATTEDATGVSLQVAAAIDSSLAVMSSFYALKGDEKASGFWQGNGNYFELGVGKFGVDKKTRSWVYDGYLGVGLGGIKNSYEMDKMDVKYVKPFLQGSIGYSHTWFEGAFSTRFAYLSYTSKEYFFSNPDYQSDAADFFRDNGSKFLVEPGVTIRLGFQKVKFNFHYNASTYSVKDPDHNVTVNNQVMLFGINYMITDRYKVQ